MVWVWIRRSLRFLFQPAWKIIFWISVAYGFLLASVTALDYVHFAIIFALTLALLLHGGLSAVAIGLIAAVAKDDRWRIPLWVVGLVAVTMLVISLDTFVLDQLITNDWWDHFYQVIAGLSAVTVLVVVWWRTSLTLAALQDLAWNFISGLAGLAVGIGLVLGALATGANHRQGDKDDNRPVIPVITRINGRYVALGDSYSAGEGLRPFQPGSAGCHRSAHGYPLLLSFDGSVDVDFRACSGATTHDVDLGIKGGFAPQIPPGSDPSVRLVTITIGGNDVIFSDIVRHCFLYEDCLDDDFKPRDPNPGRYTINYPPKQPLRTWAEEALGIASDNVERVYGRIRQAFPAARIIVLGYPYLFPSGRPPWDQADCASVLRRVDEDERKELRMLGDGLNERLYDRAFEHGLEFISPAAAWDGHEPCGTEGQYTNAVRPGSRLWNPIDGGTLHPNIRGQQQFARLVACYLNSHDRPPADKLDIPPGGVGAPIACD